VTKPADVTVEQVRVEHTWPLRAQVLRPGRPVREAAFAGELDESSGHFAAYAGDSIIGVASVLREPEPGGPGVWRLRGMAVAPDHRAQGVGAALVERVRDHVRRCGGGLLWCNARISAQGFYRAQGWTASGEPWEEPGTGPHIRMHRVEPAEPAPAG
jgi:GNAT superfamily N-acetyltransferase